MRSLTHYLFSAGVSLELLAGSGAFSLSSSLMALWLCLAINYLIDAIGHASRGGIPVRTRLTHSVFTAPLWGAMVAVVSTAAVTRLAGSNPALTSLAFWAFIGVLVSGEHLFLDSLTQAGVYSWSRRMAIAHFRYDNVALNIGFSLLGAFLIAAGLGIRY